MFGAPDGRGELFASSSSGSGVLPLAAALAAAAVLVGVGLRVVSGPRSPRPGVVARMFGFLPPLLFVTLELAESLLNGDAVGAELLEPSFVVGLALQLPFAAAAYLVVRLLLRAGDRLRTLLFPGPPPASPVPSGAVFPPHNVSRRAVHLVSTHRGRAPPAAPASAG